MLRFFLILGVSLSFLSGNLVIVNAGPNCDKEPCLSSSETIETETTKTKSKTTSTKKIDETVKIVNPNEILDCQNSGLLGCDDNSSSLEKGIENSFVYRNWIPYLIKKFFEFGAGLGVLFLVIESFLILTANFEGFENSSVDKVKSNILNIAIGVVLMLLARAIVDIIISLPLS